MDLDAKKNMLLSMIAATENESVINSLITEAWASEVAPTKSIMLKEGKPPKRRYRPREIKIHGQMYPSLRHACLNGWGMPEKEYNKICKALQQDGVVIEDLLTPRREPERRRVADVEGLIL